MLGFLYIKFRQKTLSYSKTQSFLGDKINKTSIVISVVSLAN